MLASWRDKAFLGFLEVAPDATIVVDRQGVILLANRQAEGLFGYSPGELVGQPVEILLPERFRSRHVQHRSAFAVESKPRPMGAALSLFARRRDGAEFPTEISLSPVETSEGAVVFAAIRDISERRRMQEALRLSEERLRLLVESVTEYAIYMLDTEGRIRSWGAGAERIKGYSAQEILGHHLSEFYVPVDVADGKPQRALAAAARLGQFRDEGWRLRKDGSRFLADTTLTALRDGSGVLQGFAKVTRDITERKRAEEEKERAIQARDELLSIVSHDLQNTINTLSLNTHVLLRIAPATEREERMHGYARVLRGSIDASKRLIQDLLDARQIERGELSVVRQPEETAQLVLEAVDPLRAVAAEKGVGLRTQLDDSATGVLCDRERILQVLYNLVGNAIKFVPAGGEVAVGTKRSASEVRFAVEDNGPGILPEDLPHVFDRYWQATSTVLRRGSGLGLFIVKTIVEAHGGRAWVESLPGAGASFLFTLPAA